MYVVVVSVTAVSVVTVVTVGGVDVLVPLLLTALLVVFVVFETVFVTVVGGEVGGWPEFWPEKPEFCACWSGLPPLPLPGVPLGLPSSAPRLPVRPPGGIGVGLPGVPPKLVTIWLPARVTVWVPPLPLTVMLLPNTKVETVCVWPMLRMLMPPRMPMVLDGVTMVMALVLLILPPTRRSTPLLAVSAISPFLVTGS